MSSSAVCLDASHDLLVVGHANGFIAIYQKPNLPERITKNKIRFLKPTKSWRAHIRPITTISINPSNVSAIFPRSSKRKKQFQHFSHPNSLLTWKKWSILERTVFQLWLWKTHKSLVNPWRRNLLFRLFCKTGSFRYFWHIFAFFHISHSKLFGMDG